MRQPPAESSREDDDGGYRGINSRASVKVETTRGVCSFLYGVVIQHMRSFTWSPPFCQVVGSVCCTSGLLNRDAEQLGPVAGEGVARMGEFVAQT